MSRALYYGDNLAVLRESIKDESIDLIYLDPPFNSNANYNVLFRAPTGEQSPAQIEAFLDTWHWNDSAELAFDEVIKSGNTDAADLLRAMRSFLHDNDMMAYLAMMAVRLIELRRVLRRNGSLYLHCDPTASHYLKLLLDATLGKTAYRNEIIWLRSKNPKGSQHGMTHYSPYTDTVFYYAATESAPIYSDAIRVPLSASELEEKYDRSDEFGKFADGPVLRSESMGHRPNLVYEYKGFTPGPAGWRMERAALEELDRKGNLAWSRSGAPRRKLRPEDDLGDPIGSFWGDIPPINSQARERLGYPTQKPVALLERIISGSSLAGDTILDPFCGCGTAVHAAEKLGRQWIGIDITHLAISLIERRLKDAFPGIKFEVHGTPKDIGGARDLAARDKYQFQWWAVSLVEAQPFQGKKKGADGGIDGVIYFKEDKKTTRRVLVSVKGGHVGIAQIRELKDVVATQKEPLGIFITLEKPTAPMTAEAASAGFYELHGKKLAKIQIATIEDLLEGRLPMLPSTIDTAAAFKAAPTEDDGDENGELFVT